MTLDKQSEVSIKRTKDEGDSKKRGLRGPLSEVERFYESLFPIGWLRPLKARWPVFDRDIPAVDVIDQDDHILVRAEVPGVKKEDIEVSLSDSTITICGRTKEEEREEKDEYYYHETKQGEFSRIIVLPDAVDAARASAKMKDGVLKITLPKAERAKRQAIKIETE